jgi:hypothetical protein
MLRKIFYTQWFKCASRSHQHNCSATFYCRLQEKKTGEFQNVKYVYYKNSLDNGAPSVEYDIDFSDKLLWVHFFVFEGVLNSFLEKHAEKKNLLLNRCHFVESVPFC